MKLAKTIGLFLLNKVLELFYHILKPLIINISVPILIFAIICVIFSIFGLLEIAFLYGIGLDSIADSLFIDIWTPDAPFVIRGLIVGIFSLMLIGFIYSLIDTYKYATIKLVKTKIVNFFKSNWELAKSGKIYKP